MKVLIIGAGPAGCAVAHGLKKANISFEIFERGLDVHRNRHWAFTLGWARPYLHDLLPEDLISQLPTCQVDPYVNCASIGEDRIHLFNGANREIAFSFPIPNASEINIRKLRILCAQGLDVQYGKKYSRFEELGEEEGRRVRVWFEDGTSAEGDVVLGVDGANSAVRKSLLGDTGRMEVLPFVLMNFNVSYTAEQARFIKERLHPLVDIVIHPLNHYIRLNVLDMPDPEDASTWTFQILTTWAPRTVEDYDNETERVKRLKEHVRRQGWAEPYKSAIEWVPEDTPVLKDQLKIWKTIPWGSRGGRVTLAGDAAHAMTFHRGQGANNAFFTCHCFVEAIKSIAEGKQSFQEALDEYEKKTVERGAGEVQVSKAQTFFTHDWDNYINSPVVKLGTKPSHNAKTQGYDKENEK